MGQSLLEKMRAGSDSTFMQVLIALVMLSFLGWSGRGMGDRSTTVATVNGTRILDVDYGRAFQREAQGAEMQYGRALSDAEQKMLGEQVKQRLIEDEVVLQEAKRLGLEVSDTEVARQLLAIQPFRGPDGKFSNDLYQKFLKRNRYTQAKFELELRENLLRDKLRQLVYMGANASEPAIRAAWTAANTKHDIEYVRVRAGLFDDDVQITPEELATWSKENEGQIKETYDRDFERLYNHPETVRVRMIRLAVREDGVPAADLAARLEGLRAQLEGGADFDVLARTWSEDPSAATGGDMGERPVPQLPVEVAEAVRGLEPGKLSPVISTVGDVRLYRLEARTAARVDPLESVRDAIATRLIKSERTPTLAAEFADALLAKWRETGSLPQDMLDAQQLISSRTGPITAENAGGPFSPPEKMLADAGRAKPGDILPEVYETSGILWIGRLAERQEADLSEFEANKAQIRDQYLARARMAFYTDWVAAQKAVATIE